MSGVLTSSATSTFGLIAEQFGAPVEVARVTEEGHDDREIIRRIDARLDRASSPPMTARFWKSNANQADREDQPSPDTSLRLRKNDLFGRCAYCFGHGGAGLTLNGCASRSSCRS